MFSVLHTLMLTRLQPTLGEAKHRLFGVLYGANTFSTNRNLRLLKIASPRGRVGEARRPAALFRAKGD